MIDAIKACFANGFSLAALIDAITIVVGKILGYVAEEEGYEFPSVDAE